MKHITHVFTWRMRNAAGATTVEVGLMIALIGAVCIAIVGGLGSQMNHLFNMAANTQCPTGPPRVTRDLVVIENRHASCYGTSSAKMSSITRRH